VSAVTAGIVEFCLRGRRQRAAAGTVFKVERGPAGEKSRSYGMYEAQCGSGPASFGSRYEDRDLISVFERGARSMWVDVAGDIAKLWGPRSGSGSIGTADRRSDHFAPPTQVVEPVDRGRKERFTLQLAEQDR
jgi:ribosomal protection tetracycline resistance protein